MAEKSQRLSTVKWSPKGMSFMVCEDSNTTCWPPSNTLHKAHHSLSPTHLAGPLVLFHCPWRGSDLLDIGHQPPSLAFTSQKNVCGGLPVALRLMAVCKGRADTHGALNSGHKGYLPQAPHNGVLPPIRDAYFLVISALQKCPKESLQYQKLTIGCWVRQS